MGVETLAVDRDDARVNRLAQTAVLAAEGDISDYEFLRKLALEQYDSVVVGVGSEIGTSVLVTLILKHRIHIRHVTAKASTVDHAEALRLAGADLVVTPENEAAIRLAHTLGSRHVSAYLSLGPSYGIGKVVAPVSARGRTLDSLNLLDKHHVFLLGRVRDDKVSFNPAVDETIEAGDVWVVAGRDQDLRKLEL